MYIHKGGRDIKVFQVVDGGVLAFPVVRGEEIYFRGGAAINERMLIYIETPDEYVDDEFLRKGLYEYVGTYKYVTTLNASKSVRYFRKVPEKVVVDNVAETEHSASAAPVDQAH